MSFCVVIVTSQWKSIKKVRDRHVMLMFEMWVSQVMIFGLSHGSLRGALQLLCAAAGYLGAFVAFMRSDTDSNAAWRAGLMSSYITLIYPHDVLMIPSVQLRQLSCFNSLDLVSVKTHGKRCAILLAGLHGFHLFPYCHILALDVSAMPLYCGSAKSRRASILHVLHFLLGSRRSRGSRKGADASAARYAFWA